MFVILGVQIAFARGAGAFHDLRDGGGKRRRIEAKNVLREPFEKAAPAIPGEPRITGHPDETAGGGRCAADIEHGVEHAWHRYGGPGADRNEERPAAVSEFSACRGFQIGHALIEGASQLLFGCTTGFCCACAVLDWQHERGRHWQPQRHHTSQIGRLGADLVVRPCLFAAVTDLANIHGSHP